MCSPDAPVLGYAVIDRFGRVVTVLLTHPGNPLTGGRIVPLVEHQPARPPGQPDNRTAP